MSYVQGTTVRLIGDFSDPDTRLPVVPGEIVLTIKPPTLPMFEVTRSGGDVVPDEDRAGRFYYLLDTEPEPGTWHYQYRSPDAEQKIVERKAITVTKRLVMPAA